MPIRLRSKSGDDAFLRCRTYSHAWDEFAPIDMDAPWYGWRLSLRCVRCGTERHDNISYSSGMIMSRKYIYADDYQFKNTETPTKEVFREELFSKLRADLKSHNALGGKEENAKITPIKKATTKKAAAAKKTNGGSRTRKRA